MVQASQMIDTSGGSTGGGGTFDGIFKLNGIIILKPTQPIDWNKEVVQDQIRGLIPGEVTSVSLENVKCLPEVLSELIDLIIAQ